MRRSSKTKVIIISIAAAVAVLLTVSLLWLLVFGGLSNSGDKSILHGAGDGEQNNLFYMAGSNIYFSQLKEGKSEQVTETYWLEGYTENWSLTVSMQPGLVCDDSGNRLLYLNRHGRRDDDNRGDLYIRDMSKPNEEPQKIDSNVDFDYHVSANFKSVVYLSGADGNWNLYVSDFEDKTKIDSRVTCFYANEDNSVIAYTLSDKGGSYIYKGGKKSELDSGLLIEQASDDLSVMILCKPYSDDDIGDAARYVVIDGGEKQKLASGDTVNVGTIADDGTFYFTVTDKENSMLDFVRNDEGNAGKSKMDEYRYGEFRDYLTYTTYSLYYFNGEEIWKLADKVYDTYSYKSHSGIQGRLLRHYPIFDTESVSKLDISRVHSYMDISDWFYEQRELCTETFLSVSGRAGVSLGKGANVRMREFDAECNQMYYIFGADDYGNGNLRKVKLDGSEPSDVDSDVSSIELVTPEGGVAYIKNVDEESSDLYMDGIKIDSDVLSGSVLSFRTEGYKNYYYLCDYDGDYESDEPGGTLKVVKNGKGEKIADNVWSYYPMGGGKTAVITDYQWANKSGELSVVKGDNKTHIDNDVRRIVYAKKASPSNEMPPFYGIGWYSWGGID